MKPYYDHGGITIYHADCREVLPTLADGSVDLVLTDPPYGIASVWKGGWGRGWSNARLQSVQRNKWDAKPPDDELMALVLSKGKEAVIWGGNYFRLPPSRGWLVWNKPERNFSLAEAELAWTSRDMVIRVFDYRRSDSGRQHPTQKPLALMKWCLALFPDAQMILDPFMGSGTTLRAAKDLGRRAIGIEIEEKYCEIAAKRLSQGVLPLYSFHAEKKKEKEQLGLAL
jgi:DNA modification methylase